MSGLRTMTQSEHEFLESRGLGAICFTNAEVEGDLDGARPQDETGHSYVIVITINY